MIIKPTDASMPASLVGKFYIVTEDGGYLSRDGKTYSGATYFDSRDDAQAAIAATGG